jgi:hypothetical protein
VAALINQPFRDFITSDKVDTSSSLLLVWRTAIQ